MQGIPWFSSGQRLLLSLHGGPASIPGWRTKILQVLRCGQKNGNKLTNQCSFILSLPPPRDLSGVLSSHNRHQQNAWTTREINDENVSFFKAKAYMVYFNSAFIQHICKNKFTWKHYHKFTEREKSFFFFSLSLSKCLGSQIIFFIFPVLLLKSIK